MPINYKDYHQDWKDIIRPAILKRENYCCAFCQIKNRTLVVRHLGKRVIVNDDFELQYYNKLGVKSFKIVLTVAHLNHNPQDNNYTNLAALCQACHLRYDSKQHQFSRALNKTKVNEASKKSS